MPALETTKELPQIVTLQLQAERRVGIDLLIVVGHTRAVLCRSDSPLAPTRPMKTILLIATFVTGLATSGCLVYERRTVPTRVVVQETTVSPTPRVITVLPAGYRTRVYRGVDYYHYDNVYYRRYPTGGYEVVERPW